MIIKICYNWYNFLIVYLQWIVPSKAKKGLNVANNLKYENPISKVGTFAKLILYLTVFSFLFIKQYEIENRIGINKLINDTLKT